MACLLYTSGELTLENITLDGLCMYTPQTRSTSAFVRVDEGGTLNVKAGTVAVSYTHLSCKYARRAKNIRKCIQILAHFYLDCTLRHCYNKVWPNVRFIEKGLRDLFGKPGVLS